MNFSFEVLQNRSCHGGAPRQSDHAARRNRNASLHAGGHRRHGQGLTQDALEELGAGIILANTYHLYLRPGHELIRKLGGLHSFMSWRNAILTDSGGYQVFSLSDLRKITDEGVRFRSHLDGSEHLLTPEKAAEIQLALGSDIAMVLDECIETPAPRHVAEAALQRTTAWGASAPSISSTTRAATANPPQWQFGIVQGATFADLRRESARQLLELDFPGYAVGGFAVGEPHEVTCEMAAEVTALLPQERPRYLMGVGRPEQLADYVARGIDMMDCVLPTRAARHACLYTSEGRVLIKNARYIEDQRPIDPNLQMQRVPPLHPRVSSASFRRWRDHRRHPGDPPQCELLP